MNPRIEQLKKAVEKACACKVRHAGSKAVIEGFEGQAVWDGIVETFELKGHPNATACYAFMFVDADRPVIKTVLSVPPISSELDAVRAAIAAEERGK